MKTWTRTTIAIALAGLLASGAVTAKPRNVTDPDAPRALPAEGAVQVQWTDPAQFTELRHSNNRWEARRGNWVEQLATHLRERADRELAPGQRLDVTITDIKRAGDFEPWQSPQFRDVRFMRDLYPPRISLQFTLTDARGQVLEQGERKLVDSAYLHGPGLYTDQDPLRYEKRLIDEWLRRELRAERATAGL
jgi:hypothetical protein